MAQLLSSAQNLARTIRSCLMHFCSWPVFVIYLYVLVAISAIFSQKYWSYFLIFIKIVKFIKYVNNHHHTSSHNSITNSSIQAAAMILSMAAHSHTNFQINIILTVLIVYCF